MNEPRLPSSDLQTPGSQPIQPWRAVNINRWIVLVAAFLAWLFAGVQMSITSLVSNSATKDFLQSSGLSADVIKQQCTVWFARHNATFLLGAATGGLLFGWFGDRFGRAKALGLSICCYSFFSFVAAFVDSPEAYVLVRFLGCLGVGGAWPNGIALASETWSDVSKPVLAGVIGTAANMGLVLMGVIAIGTEITPVSWRWVMMLGSAPFFLGLISLAVVRESPKWLAAGRASAKKATPVRDVFKPPLLRLTLLGIVLGALPLFGGWGCTNWLIPWADQVGAQADPSMKAWTQVYRSTGASVTSLLGGWVAFKLGRKPSYFLFSLASLLVGQYIYRYLTPSDPEFNWWTLALGATTGFYFGWLPLCLPEMFPTRVRSTGAGVTFNFGRYITAAGVLGAGWLSSLPYFHGDYGKVGSVTSLVFAIGLLTIWFLPTPEEHSNT